MKLQFIKYKLVLLYAFFLGSIAVQAQEHPPVFILTGAHEYNSHFNTGTKLTDQLINTGEQGKATVEFWLMKADGRTVPEDGYWRFSNLKLGANRFRIMGTDKRMFINIAGTQTELTLGKQERFWNNAWHHIALAIDQKRQRMAIYVDGELIKNLSYPANFSPQLLYFSAIAGDRVSMAEFRAWNRLRTPAEIKRERFVTIANESISNLKNLNLGGLVVAYAGNKQKEEKLTYSPTERLLWYNMLSSGVADKSKPAYGNVTSKVRFSNKQEIELAQLRTDTDHPIYSLKDVMLSASIGDAMKGNTNYIELKWPHIKGATRYIIRRKQANNPLDKFTTVDSYVPNSQEGVSSYLKYRNDRGILPNEIYTYEVAAEGVPGSKPGQANGFVFSNGIVKGAIASSERIATEGALVAAALSTGAVPGHSLRFEKGASPIVIENSTRLSRSSGAVSIEFWYRNTSNATGTNTVLKIADSEVRVNNSNVSLVATAGGEQTYLSAAKPNDTEWHHFAFVLTKKGGALYIDGGKKQPLNKKEPIVPNAVAKVPLVNDLSRDPEFYFNAKASTSYEFDEVRFWDVARTTEQIFNNYKLVLGNTTSTDLALYYRFDLNDPHGVYNQALRTVGKFAGKSLTKLKPAEQPFVWKQEKGGKKKAPIVYGVYTDAKGGYRFTSLNIGNQSAGAASNAIAYNIIPSKPNNEFSPKLTARDIPRTLNPAEPSATLFTNISQYDITGKVMYLAQVEGQAKPVEFPTVQNTTVKLNGKVVNSSEKNSLVRTNNQGVYKVSGAPGRYEVSIGQPQLDKANLGTDRISLDFKSDGYAQSFEAVEYARAKQNGFVWSGFVKADVVIDDKKPVERKVQTVLHWGKLRLELRMEKRPKLVVMHDGTELLTTVIDNDGQYRFFALTYNGTTNNLGFLVNTDYQNTSLNIRDTSAKVVLGATKTAADYSKYARANMDIIEYRSEHYTVDELGNIKNGSVVKKDQQSLLLSYRFEHTEGNRAVNLAPTLTGRTNNYLTLHQGAQFNNASSSKYLRKFEFEYRAYKEGDAKALVNPANDKVYLFNLLEPALNINFENTTRRTFVGNIVIPCNNNVGDWEGIIERTDVAFPKYQKKITASNFNVEKNMFTVHDLVPGQYSVTLTRKGTADVIKSAVIDMRTQNSSYDFLYRNQLQASVELYSLTKKEFDEIDEMKDQQARIAAFQKAKITPTCGTGARVYKLVAGQSILAKVNVFESYSGSTCPVANATVNLSGDMIIRRTEGLSEKTGVKSFLTSVGSPNFSGNYQRNLALTVNHKGRTLTTNVAAYVTGARRGNQDFTLLDPTVGMVLYDPPGSNSSATLSRGANYSFSKSVVGGKDISTDTSITLGSDISNQFVTLAIAAPLGVGAGQGIIYTAVESEAKFTGKIKAGFTYRHTSQNSLNMALTQEISTSDGTTYTGEDADVFVGVSRVLTFGTGKTLEVGNDCVPRVLTDKKIMSADNFTPFVYTRQDIEDNLLKDLRVLLIKKHDELFPPSADAKKKRENMERKEIIAGFKINKEDKNIDKKLLNYVYQIESWEGIVKRKTRAEKLAYLTNKTTTFENTTSDLKTVGNDRKSSVTQLDNQISFSGGASTTYSLERSKSQGSGNSGGATIGGGKTFSKDLNLAGVAFSLQTDLEISGLIEGSSSSEHSNSRVDKFTLADADAGDHFSVRIGRDKTYDTPYFYTVAGKSMCPFESGTASRVGVEIAIDNNVKYKAGDGVIEYELTLRNTQTARDDTKKTYYVGMVGSSNQRAQVFLNESPIFEPTTASTISFEPVKGSDTGVKKEVKAILKIKRGEGEPETISYKDIKIKIWADCEKDDYESYRVDEYAEIGIKPVHVIPVTAHFTGACVNKIETTTPGNNWVVNNTKNNKLKFRFRIPELVAKKLDDNFKVELQYTLPGNDDDVKKLKVLSMQELKANMDKDTGFITYLADISGLSDGAYRFRIAPKCDDGGANLPANSSNPTTFVNGNIRRTAPVVIQTNPVNGGVLTAGEITTVFNRAINPQTAVNSSFSLRGILGGLPKDLIAADFDTKADFVKVPHIPELSIAERQPFTIEMWLKPKALPSAGTATILKKGTNYELAIASDGTLVVNKTIRAGKALKSAQWTHVAVTRNTAGDLKIYYNGVSVGGGQLPSVTANDEALWIAKEEGGQSFIGSIDELKIWTKEREVPELVKHMDKQLVGNELELKAYFAFDNNALKGVGARPDEAIRDYTGNAIGTTAAGLSFTRGVGNAAPLDVTKIAKNVQFQILVSNGDTKVHIKPVLDASFVEGAKLTAMVLGNRLEDPFGNKVSAKAWSFIVNKNTIKWSANNVSVKQTQGVASTIDHVNFDNSKGGSDIKYRFKQIPSWLTIQKNGKKVAPNTFLTLRAGFVASDLSFTVAPYLNPGIHETDVYAEVIQTIGEVDTTIGIESFNLKVEVACATPDFAGDFNQGSFIGNMSLNAKLMINGTQSLDSNDIVAVYKDGQYRGQATVGDDGLVRLAIYGSAVETGALTFKVWDASECTEYSGVVERYTYQIRKVLGNLTPVTLTVGSKLSRRISLSSGYQEVSFNLRDNASGYALSLSAIKGLGAGDQLYRADDFKLLAEADARGRLIRKPDATDLLDVRKAYIVRLTSTKIKFITVEGVKVPLTTDIAIAGGNAQMSIPYYPNSLQTIPIALSSLNATTVSIGDRIERRTLHAVYTAEGWKGSLTHLTPNLGYLYTAKNPGVLNYSGIASRAGNRIPNAETRSTDKQRISWAKSLQWQVDEQAYPRFMYVVGQLDSEVLDTDKEYLIAAFVGKEVRGVAKPVRIDDQWYYYIGIGGVAAEELSFKLFDGEQVVALENRVPFKVGAKGSVVNPFVWQHREKGDTNEATALNLGYNLLQNEPNPMSTNTRIRFSVAKAEWVDLSVYNLLGQKVQTLHSGVVEANTWHQIQWNSSDASVSIKPGMYIYKLTTATKQISKKLLVK